MLNPSKNYYSKNQILYDEYNNEILKFNDNIPNKENYSLNELKSINNYIRCYPDRIQVIEPKKNVQLNLF